MTLQEFAERVQGASRELRGALLQELVNTALRAETEAKLRVTAGGVTRLNVRTGRLRASIAGGVHQDGDAIVVEVSAGGRSPNSKQLSPNTTRTPGEVRYAAIHEYGGTIRPSRRQFLTIPVHESLRTGAGVARFASARDVPGLQYAETSGGQRLLIHEDSGEVFYLLRRSMTLPARPYLRPAIRTAGIRMNSDVLRALRKSLVFGRPSVRSSG
jgi:phage gpG-like protein